METATSPANSTTPVDAVREPAGEADFLRALAGREHTRDVGLDHLRPLHHMRVGDRIEERRPKAVVRHTRAVSAGA